MDYVVVGAVRSVARSAAPARDGHAVLLCDADANHVAAINERRSEDRGARREVQRARAAVSPDRLPDRLSTVRLAVKTEHTAAALDAIAPRLAPPASSCRCRTVSTSLRSPTQWRGADGWRVRQLRRGLLDPGPSSWRQGVAVWAVDGSASDRVAASFATSAAPHRRNDPRLPLGQGGVRRHARRDRRLRPLDCGRASGRGAERSSCASRARCSRVAPGAGEPFDGFDRRHGGLDRRLVEFNRRSARTHSGIYRDLAVRRRKTETALLGEVDGPIGATDARADARSRTAGVSARCRT